MLPVANAKINTVFVIITSEIFYSWIILFLYFYMEWHVMFRNKLPKILTRTLCTLIYHWVSISWSFKFYSVSSIKLRTVFISFNSILISECPTFIWWFVSVGTPSTSSFFSLNVMQAQSIASLGISHFISINSFTEIQ